MLTTCACVRMFACACVFVRACPCMVAVACDSYAVFDFVLRHYRDASRWPLTMDGRPVQDHVGPVGDAVAAVRTYAAATSTAALRDAKLGAAPPRRLFGTWSRDRVVHMPLGVFGPFVPIDNASSDASEPQPFVYNPAELLLGKPRLASERQFLATFIGNRHPKVCAAVVRLGWWWVGVHRCETLWHHRKRRGTGPGILFLSERQPYRRWNHCVQTPLSMGTCAVVTKWLLASRTRAVSRHQV